MDEGLEKLTALVRDAEKIVVFSGAGISTESGIPDFRSPGGVWEKFDPNEFHIDRFLASEQSRRRYWQRTTEFWAGIAAAQPNAGHMAVVELEKLGKISAVITQNVDGLHQIAGTSPEKVIELHGTSRKVHCLGCGESHQREAFQAKVSADGHAPDCESCGGLMKPATISFGQMLPPEAIDRASRETENCDLFMVIGSSLVVYPAAGFPLLAVKKGAPLVIVNLQETPHDPYAAVVVREKSGDVLPLVISGLSAGRPLPTPPLYS
ncbi:MAG: Sir2 family NAD-dependent protein deacetylase [bacterium]